MKQSVVITPPNFQVVEFYVKGTSPLVINKVSKKAKDAMKARQEEGSVAKKGKKREAKDFNQCYNDARRISEQGWDGITTSAFKNAMVSACKIVGFAMTRAKLGIVKVLPDGIDREDAMPLVKIDGGIPTKIEMFVKNETGVADIRARPMWKEWECRLRVEYDADMFSTEDIASLVSRAGAQVGVGEGRADSPKSVGMGWGYFSISNEGE